MKCIQTLLVCLLLSGAPVRAHESAKALQEAFMSALRANDAAGLAACYSEDAVNFSVDKLVGIGPDSPLQSWSGFFSAYKLVAAELSQDHLEIHGDTAIAWGVFTIMAEPTAGGEPVAMIGRYMDVARNFDGNWLYVADHASMPLPAAEPEASPDDATAPLRQAIKTFYQAYYDRDWDLYYSFYADDVVFIDSSGNAMNLQEYNASAAVEAEALGELLTEGLDALVPQVKLNTGGDSAVAYWKHSFTYEKPGAKRTTVLWAETDVWWKIDGAWKVTHIHYHAVSD